MWLSMRDWTKEQTRAVLQPYNVLVLGVSALMLAVDGVYDRETLVIMAVALPTTLIAAQVGIGTFRRLDDLQFRRLLVAMMLLSGLILLGRELL